MLFLFSSLSVLLRSSEKMHLRDKEQTKSSPLSLFKQQAEEVNFCTHPYLAGAFFKTKNPLNNPLNDPLNDLLNDILNDPLNDPLNPLNDSLNDPLNDPLNYCE